MRIVIDSNRMQSDELRAFLSLSPDNFAVLTNYAAMEAFQGDTLVSIQASWSVLRDFPMQILALRGTREAGLVSPESAGIANRMISKPETKGVQDFARLLDRAASGDSVVQRQLLQRGKWADDHMNSMLAGAENIGASIAEFRGVFTDAELARLRKEQPWTPVMGEKLVNIIDVSAAESFAKHPGNPRWPRPKHLMNHFLYRHALTYLIYMLRLVQRGARNRKPAKARNDAVDVIFATYATYFNGLMSMDDEASAVHAIARGILKQAGARVPEDYFENYA